MAARRAAAKKRPAKSPAKGAAKKAPAKKRAAKRAAKGAAKKTAKKRAARRRGRGAGRLCALPSTASGASGGWSCANLPCARRGRGEEPPPWRLSPLPGFRIRLWPPISSSTTPSMARHLSRSRWPGSACASGGARGAGSAEGGVRARSIPPLCRARPGSCAVAGRAGRDRFGLQRGAQDGGVPSRATWPPGRGRSSFRLPGRGGRSGHRARRQ